MALLGKGKKEDPLELMKRGKHKQAIPILEERLKQNPNDISTKMRLAEAYDGDGRKKDAARVYAREAEVRMTEGKLSEAASFFKMALRLTPGDEALKSRLAQAERTAPSAASEDSSFSFDVDAREATSDQAVVGPAARLPEAAGAQAPKPMGPPPPPAPAFEVERGFLDEGASAPRRFEPEPPPIRPEPPLAETAPPAKEPPAPKAPAVEPKAAPPEIPAPAPVPAPPAEHLPEESPALLEEIAQVGQDTASFQMPEAVAVVTAEEDGVGDVPAAPLEKVPEAPAEKAREASLEETFTNFIAILFPDLPSADLSAIRSVSKLRRIGRGEVLIREGEEGDSLFILTGGRLEAKGTFGGKELKLAALSPGDILGEVAFLKKVPRTATVTALEPSTVIELQGERTRKELGSHPNLLNQLEVILQDRVYQTLGLIKDAGKNPDGHT